MLQNSGEDFYYFLIKSHWCKRWFSSDQVHAAEKQGDRVWWRVWESVGGQSDELNKPSDSPLRLTYLSVTWGSSRVSRRCILAGGTAHFLPRKEPQWADWRRASERRGGAWPRLVYHHAEVVLKQGCARHGTAMGTCWLAQDQRAGQQAWRHER